MFLMLHSNKNIMFQNSFHKLEGNIVFNKIACKILNVLDTYEHLFITLKND
jgi:hypothetical protein